jgi:hypothetical protein
VIDRGRLHRLPPKEAKLSEPPSSSIGLTAALARSRADYGAKWHVVDQELYQLCRRRPSHRDFADVYAKVTIIGRVYAAGISRSSRADGDRESAVAQGIIRQAAAIDAALETLASAPFSRVTATRMIELHAQVARGLKQHTGDRWLQSFVSKYLHFHCEHVPIFDSRAETSIGQFVDWASVYRLREAVGRPSDWLTRYYFATAFVALSERIAGETGTRASVKEIDHMLWQAK